LQGAGSLRKNVAIGKTKMSVGGAVKENGTWPALGKNKEK